MPAAPAPRFTVADDLDLLLRVMPPPVQAALAARDDRDELLEVVLDLGRVPEARFPDRGVFLGEEPVTRADLDGVASRVGRFGEDNRAGIAATLHRISAIRNRGGEIVGLTCRVGRAVFGTVAILREEIESGRSLLLLGRPGVGKTTLLREAARVLADELGQRVVVVDTSNEIAGDGDVPHPGIGRARRMQVPSPAAQAAVMIEAVENHMPEVIVIDEIGTEAEARAARTIAERGVQLIATAHGNTLENLLQNPTLADLVGGIQAVTLSDEEARRRGTQKTVLERKAPPTFEVLVEIQGKDVLAVHHDVAEVVDEFLRGEPPRPERRVRREGGEVEIEEPSPFDEDEDGEDDDEDGDGQPLSWTFPPREDAEGSAAGPSTRPPERPTARPGAARGRWPGAADGPGARRPAPGRVLRIYPYAVSKPRLERTIQKLRVPAFLVDEPGQADVVLTTKGHERRAPRRLREGRRPLHALRSNTLPQMEKFLRSVFDVERRDEEQAQAAQEAARAVAEALAARRPVELAPRGSTLRRVQHEVVERHRLTSESRGVEPFRRVVVLPP